MKTTFSLADSTLVCSPVLDEAIGNTLEVVRKDKVGGLVGLELSLSFFGVKCKVISFLYRSWALQSKKAGKILEGSSWKAKQGCFLGRLTERRRGAPFPVRTNTKAAFCCYRVICHFGILMAILYYV